MYRDLDSTEKPAPIRLKPCVKKCFTFDLWLMPSFVSPGKFPSNSSGLNSVEVSPLIKLRLYVVYQRINSGLTLAWPIELFNSFLGAA